MFSVLVVPVLWFSRRSFVCWLFFPVKILFFILIFSSSFASSLFPARLFCVFCMVIGNVEMAELPDFLAPVVVLILWKW
jgi:hypothetical protein